MRARSRIGPAVMATALLLVAVIAAFGWLALRVATAGMELMAVSAAGRELVAAVESGDPAAAAAAARTTGAHARAAAAATADPLWPVAEQLPWFGDDLRVVRVLATHAGALSDNVVEPVLDLIDTGAAADPERFAAAVGDARSTARAAADTVAEIDTTDLIAPIRDAALTSRDLLTGLSSAVDSTAALTAFLGAATAEGRSVLVALQNPAELRTGGGITGSFVLLRAHDGDIELVEQADSSQFPAREAGIVEQPDSRARLYGDVVARFVQNASMPVDFAETAGLARAWWQSRGGEPPDAILSLDPLALRGLLAATGPVALGDGTELTADNLVQRIVVEPYRQFDSDAQTVFLQSVSIALFDRLRTLDIEPLTWLRALSGPVAEGRIALWSADPDVQRAIDGTALAGPGGRLAAAGPGAFGVFFNDATGGKMDTFLHTDMAIDATCRADGLAEVRVSLTMSSSAPDPAELTPHMTGNGLFGTAVGDIGTSVSVVAPPDSYFGGVTKDGERELSVDVVDAGRPTSLVRINLSPAEMNVVEFRFIVAAPHDLAVVHTPLINEPVVTVGVPVACD